VTLHTIAQAALIAALSTAAMSVSQAGEPAAARDDKQVWREECGSCHVAYPARLLSRESWDAIMRGLDDHFGDDAAVDEAVAASIRRYLASASRPASRAATATPTLRITESRWFTHEHDDVSASTWRSPKVGSAANCAACHRDAEAGRFDEDTVNSPE